MFARLLTLPIWLAAIAAPLSLPKASRLDSP